MNRENVTAMGHLSDETPEPERDESLRGTAYRAARLAAVGFLLSRGVLFGVYIVLARLVSPAEFGRYTAASVITSVGSLFSESGMASALIRRRDRMDEAASSAFFSLLVSGVLLTLGALAISPLIGLFFSSGRVGLLCAGLSGVLLLEALGVVPDALLQRRFSFLRRVAIDPLAAVAFALAAVTAAVGGLGAWSLVWGAYASMIVSLVAAWSFAGFRPRRRLASMAVWRELARFARPVVGSEILYRAAAQLDAVLLGRFKGPASLGQYRNGLRLAQQPSEAFLSVAAYVLLPTLVRISDQPQRLRGAALQILGLLAAVALPASLLALPLGEPIAIVILGQRWGPAGHAISGLCGLLIGSAVISVVSEIYKAVDRPRLLIRLHSVNLATIIVFVGAAAIPFGLIGVAIAVSLSRCVTAAYGLRLAAPLVGLGPRDVGRAAARPLLATVVMLACTFAFGAYAQPLTHRGVATLALTVAEAGVGIAAYAATLLTLDRVWRQRLSGLLTAAWTSRRNEA
jgi:O-antigen/teichoic acid export membrane protein